MTNSVDSKIIRRAKLPTLIGRAVCFALVMLAGHSSLLAETQFTEPSIVTRHLTIKDGLPNSFVRCIFQDSRQFMWFGDRHGLAFYDGQNFRYHKIGEVRGIQEDTQGFLWIHHASTLSQLDPETDIFESVDILPPDSAMNERIFALCSHPDSDKFWLFYHTAENSERLGNAILFDPVTRSIEKRIDLPGMAAHPRCVCVDSNAIWARGIEPHILKRVDLITNKTRTFDFGQQTKGTLGIESLYPDSDNLWVITTDGVLHRLDSGDEKSSFPFVTTRGTSGLIGAGATPPMCSDEKGQLWIATDGHGLFRFSPDTEQFVSFRHKNGDRYSLNADRISGIYRDRHDNFWLNTQGSGVDCFASAEPPMQHLAHLPESDQSLGHSAVWAIFHDHEGVCWFGHQEGLDRFDPATGTFQHFKQSIDDSSTISVGRNISVIFEDSSHRLWVGSWNGGLNQFDRETGKFKHYNYAEDDEHSLQSNRISAIMEDHNQNLWIGTSRGLSRYVEGQDHFERVPVAPNDAEFPDRLFLRTIVELPDEPGYLWLGGWEGLGLVRYDVNSRSHERFAHDPSDATTLSHDTIRFIHPAKDGALWVGTSDGLNKFDRKTKNFTRFTTADGMPANAVCGIAEDDEGTLWISTSRGLCQFHPDSETFNRLGVTDGVRNPEFTQRSYFQAKDGTLYFGGVNGVDIFHPKLVTRHHYSAPLHVTGLKLFNDSTSLKNSLQKHVWATDKVVLDRNENVFSFEFASLNYLQKESMQYRYRLTGFQDDWTEVGPNNRVATYTNLRPGNYTFEVNQATSDGIWLEEQASVELEIQPAWWETSLFRSLFVATVLFAGFTVYRNRIRTYQRRTRKFSNLYDALRQEVKEREQAVKDFQMVSNEFSRLFQDAREAIYFSTPSGHLLNINPAGVELLGYQDKSEVLSTDIMELLHIDSTTQAEFFRRIKESGFVSDFELSIRRKDGQQLYVVVSASAVLNEDGRIKEIHGIVYDLTRKKELESQLFQSQKLEAVGTLAAGIAHDFNNLLTVIMTNAEIIKSSPKPSCDLSAENNAIMLACNNAARLTNQLLTYSRQDTAYRRTAPTSVVEIVRDVGELIASTLPKRISLRTSFDPNSGFVTADPAQLQQIAMNLCTNAIQAIGKQKGEISLSVCTRVIKGETSGSFRRLDGPHVELRIKDNGVGIPEDALGRLFDPFYTTRERGTGLGLSVVHGIVEELGGRIDVASRSGHGSEFIVLLPQSKPSTTQFVDHPLTGTHILLADDEPAVRTAFEKILRVQGYQISTAADGFDAMRLLEAEPDAFDIIVTDERMPNMTGTQLAKEARRIRPDIPVLLISGHAVSEPLGASLQGFIRKPINATELHERIQVVLANRSDSKSPSDARLMHPQ